MADVEKIIINEQSYPVKDVNAVSVLKQSLTAEQKAQVQANIGVTAATNVYTKSETDTLLNGKISATAKGASNGVAELDSNGKVPSSQLPSFVDDVIEGYYKTSDDRFYEESTFITLIEPIAGKSWVDIPANKSYRWTGSVYTRVDEGVQIGETSDTAYAGNKGKANADAIAAIKDGVSIDSFADVETALADKISKSQTAGLVKNDGTIDTTNYISDVSAKADKVSGATNGNFAGLDANGNLVDSGKKASDFAQVQSDWAQYNSAEMDYIKNKPPLAINGGGTGGNIIGGTGVNENSTRYTNSVAYGAFAAAIADHAFAFGNRAFAGSNKGGKHAVAIGNNVRAEKDYEFAYGKFNQSNDDTAFSFGDGTSENDRHNLMELKTDGTLLLNGNAVKTEGGDDDNKLRLGQVFDLSNTNPYGIYNYNYGYGLKIVEFSSVEVRNKVTDVKQVGDFVLYKTGSSPSTDKIMFAPIAGRTAGKTLTGAWVKAECLYELFNNCSTLTSIDLTPVDTSEVGDMTRMFYGCTALKTLDISSFDMSNVIEYTDMFTNDTALTTLKCPKINPHDDIPLPRTLYSQDGTAYTNLPVTTGTSIELRQSWT